MMGLGRNNRFELLFNFDIQPNEAAIALLFVANLDIDPHHPWLKLIQK